MSLVLGMNLTDNGRDDAQWGSKVVQEAKEEASNYYLLGPPPTRRRWSPAMSLTGEGGISGGEKRVL